jgi:hypothetical protein
MNNESSAPAENVLYVANSGTIHATTAQEITAGSQVKEAGKCSRRKVYGYVRAAGTNQVTCPKCLAL